MSSDDTHRPIHSRGRPGKNAQLEIQRELRKYFISGVSPWTASAKTGHSINTVRKYYKKSYDEIIASEGPSFDESCRERKAQACIAIDKEILAARRMQDELEKISLQPSQLLHLYKLRMRLVEIISGLHIKRLDIANTPTIKEMVDALSKGGDKQ